MYLLDKNTVQSLITFENRGIFEDLHYQYSFGLVTFQRGGTTDSLKGIFQQTNLDILRRWKSETFEIPRKVLIDYSPEARIFPYVTSEKEVSILESILSHPRLSKKLDNNWFVDVTSELDRNLDTERFFETEQDYPIIGGKNVYQFCYDNKIFDTIRDVEFWSVDDNKNNSGKWRLKEKEHRRIKKEIYTQLDGTGSQKSFVNDLLEKKRNKRLSEEDVLLDASTYRIIFRKIARSTDERTMIASVIPPNRITEYSVQAIRCHRIEVTEEKLTETPLRSIYEPIFSPNEMFVLVGLLNSIPFDFLMRTKIDSNIPKYKIMESQMPRLTQGDDWFEYISKRAARLNCYGDDFQNMRNNFEDIEPVENKKDRQQIQSEIDAASFLAYGLNLDETEYVLDDFHRVKDPRIMDDEYFQMVLEQYKHLNKTGPYK